MNERELEDKALEKANEDEKMLIIIYTTLGSNKKIESEREMPLILPNKCNNN